LPFRFNWFRRCSVHKDLICSPSTRSLKGETEQHRRPVLATGFGLQTV
jgi:hypothetical protein